MLAVQSHPDGCILPVQAQPGARKNAVIGEHGGALKVSVAAPPERGKANKALLQLIRDILELKRGQIELIGGETSHAKRLLIRGLTTAELLARLTAFVQ
jgi:uncharacterized protein (TIGR00251 family)